MLERQEAEDSDGFASCKSPKDKTAFARKIILDSSEEGTLLNQKKSKTVEA